MKEYLGNMSIYTPIISPLLDHQPREESHKRLVVDIGRNVPDPEVARFACHDDDVSMNDKTPEIWLIIHTVVVCCG